MRFFAAVFKFAPLLFFLSLGAYSSQASEVKVYAAASLADAINELSGNYQQSHLRVKIQAVYAASSTLAKQIENGAPADLFLSADLDWADYLDKRDLFAAGSRKNLLGNNLVLIAPAGKVLQVRIERGFNLPAAFEGKLCIGEPGHVPAGKYAQQSLSFYGWWNALESRLVGTDDVRTAAAFVERGECPLGVVYSTDAKISKKISVIATFPAASHKPIIYPGALLKNANADGKAFWQYLQGNEARQVFIRYGFNVL